MKKTYFWTLALVVSFCLFSCHNAKNKELSKETVVYRIHRTSNIESANTMHAKECNTHLKGSIASPALLPTDPTDEDMEFTWQDTVLMHKQANQASPISSEKIISKHRLEIENLVLNEKDKEGISYIITSQSHSEVSKYKEDGNKIEFEINGLHSDTIFLPKMDKKNAHSLSKAIFLERSTKIITQAIQELNQEIDNLP